jgi:membrane-anchored glycerophosphoryl diester phosphodiesterase (GDPDase)
MVLKKRKKLMQKSGTKRSLFRLRLKLFHVVLDIILIVLVINPCTCTASCFEKYVDKNWIIFFVKNYHVVK